MISRPLSTRIVPVVVGAIAVILADPAQADEGGASLYLLGSGTPDAAVLPPVPGIFLDDSIYVYDASAGAERDFVIGGKIVADVDATIVADFVTVLWVPSTNFLGGTLAVGGALPIGAPLVDAAAVITGPGGREIGVKAHDSALFVGDPIATAALGWKSGSFHFAVTGQLNVPVGRYREGELANLAFHRWAGDISVAGSWHEEASGWDVSGKVGFTLNGTNHATDYTSGTDFHLEASVEKQISERWAIGVIGFHFQQISDDTGAGATLGGYRGRVSGAGGTVAYNTVMGRSPATFRLRVLQEFNVKNRTKGTAAMFSLSLPLSMKVP